MKSSIAFAVLHQSISFFIGLPAVICIILGLLRKIIFINEVISRVIGGIGCLTTFDTITRLFP